MLASAREYTITTVSSTVLSPTVRRSYTNWPMQYTRITSTKYGAYVPTTCAQLIMPISFERFVV